MIVELSWFDLDIYWKLYAKWDKENIVLLVLISISALRQLVINISSLSLRAAAQSKLGHYTDAIKDCEKAIAIDSKYSKAYGRMG